jgi:hypothetical protein
VGGPPDLDAVVEATTASTARLRITYEAPELPKGWPADLVKPPTLQGLVDFRHHRAEVDLAKLGRPSQPRDLVIVGRHTYVRTFRRHGSWQYRDLAPTAPTDSMQPWALLDALRDASGLTEAGRAHVRGVVVTHYTVTPVARSWITDVWIDDAGLVVRLRQQPPASPPTTEVFRDDDGVLAGAGGSITFKGSTIDLWDFGVEADIPVPANASPTTTGG